MLSLMMAPDSRPKSFRDIMRYHSGFLVHPVQWTSRHLDLVRCRFEDVATTPVYTETTGNGYKDKDADDGKSRPKRPRGDAEEIAVGLCPIEKRRRLINILVGEGRPFAYFSKGPRFYFQGRQVHRPEYVVFRRREESIDQIHNSSPPLAGYVQYSSVNGDRRHRFEAYCLGPQRTNDVCHRICLKRLAQTKPKEWTEDPYFVCHLLALAQLQERNLKSLKPMAYTSRLLVTHFREHEHMLFYEAEITAELLNGLKNPMKSTTPMEWPTIRRKKLPYKPYDTFADRLVAELAAPSPLLSRSPLCLSDNVTGVIEHGRKRPHEQEDSESRKMTRGQDDANL